MTAKNTLVAERVLGTSPVIVVCGLPFEAALVAGPGIVTVRGPGPDRVAAGIDALIAGDPDPARAWVGIVSFGCAGGLDPALAPGACVVATAIVTTDGTVAADPDWSGALLARLSGPCAGPSFGTRQGTLYGTDAPLTTPAAKARLWREHGACAADMESHAAARAARRHGLPFAACRVVLDPAWRGLPGCVLAALRADGGLDPRALLRTLAAEVGQRGQRGQLGQLAALVLDAWRARRTLRRIGAQLPAVPAPGRPHLPGAAS